MEIRKLKDKYLLDKGYKYQVIYKGRSHIFKNKTNAEAFIIRGKPKKR